MLRLFIAYILLAFPSFVFAQRFGGTPPGVKWKQISTDTVRVIYPAGLDSQAQRVASLVHYEAIHKGAALGNQLQKINIVLQNQTTIANAYVGLGPWRSEFYLTPSPDNFGLGSLPWADQLSIHEYRHVEQFNNFRNGLSNLMRVLFGEEGYALAVNAAVPDWFFEGDAVYNETVFSGQGRGRLPFFLNAYPALWQANKQYSWMKLRNGSLKDYVPNHYNLGYLLVNYGYEKYGLDFWGKVTHDASAFKGLFYPFQKAIEKHTGLNYRQFRDQAFDYYKKLYSPSDTLEKNFNAQAVLPVNKHVVTDYVFPYNISDDSLLYLQAAYNKRPGFYIKDKNGARRLKTRSISLDQQFSYRNGKIVYSAYETDPRWWWRDYSVIKILDANSKKEKTLKHKTKYFNPDISESGKRVIAVEAAISGKSELHILDASTGKIESRISAAEIILFTAPKFVTEDTIISAVRLQDGRMALAVSDISTGSTVRLTPPSFNVVGYPNIQGRIVYFSASYGGSDNIFALNMDDNKIYQLTNWPLGNYYVNAGNGKINWSVFTAEGYQLQQSKEKELKWKLVDNASVEKLSSVYPVSHTSEIPRALSGKLPIRSFSSSDYKKSTRLFNFHSWRPYYEDPEFTFSLYGQNVLNTLESELYYLYNQNDRTNAVGANFTFGQLFPYLSAGTQYTFDRMTVASNGRTKQWAQWDSRIGFNIPLSWATGRTYKQFNIGSSYHYRNDINKGVYKDSFTTVRFSYLQHFLSWSQQVEMAPQHIFPRLGYNFSLQYRHIITNYTSWQFLGKAALFLPGFFPTHSIVLTGAYQETDTVNAAFGNIFPYARGYNALYFPTVASMWGWGANYHFPVLYPDWGFANILYLTRLRANGFFDFTRVFSRSKLTSADQRSVGGEVYIDTKWWNQYSLTFGFRVSHLLDRDYYTGQTGATVFEFILPVSIIPR